jgi:hypothetical protein
MAELAFESFPVCPLGPAQCWCVETWRASAWRRAQIASLTRRLGGADRQVELRSGLAYPGVDAVQVIAWLSGELAAQVAVALGPHLQHRSVIVAPGLAAGRVAQRGDGRPDPLGPRLRGPLAAAPEQRRHASAAHPAPPRPS